jgi:hypothetical protein
MSEIEAYFRQRISSPDYRGIHLAQHNRIPEEKLVALLASIQRAVKDKEFLIPPGDEPNPTRRHNPTEARQVRGFEDYYTILDEISSSGVAGVSATFNSLKKNHFPNLDAMGLIHRQVPQRGTTEPGRARLSAEALEIVSVGTSHRRKILIGDAMQRLLGNKFIEGIHALLNRVDVLNVYELMLIVSDKHLDIDQKEKLVRDYRRLKMIGRLQLHSELESKCASTMTLPKVDMRDWHNWWNESKQVMSMLALVPGFNVYNDDQVMLAGYAGLVVFDGARSQQVKQQALLWHGLERSAGWELHHILPVAYATCESDMRAIDSKENLLYIPAQQHRRIPNRQNRSVKLEIRGNVVRLLNPMTLAGDPSFDFDIPIQAQLDSSKAAEMVDYNNYLLNSVL